MALEINQEAVRKEAIAQIGEFQLPENGSKIELELRDGAKIKGALVKVTADKIYLEVEADATHICKLEQLAPGSRWKFFKAEYDKKLKTVIDEITEDKKAEAEVRDKKAAGLALKKEAEKPPDTPKVEEKKTVESIKKEFGEFKLPEKDSVFELELTDGTKVSGKINKVKQNKVYVEVEEGRVSIHKQDKISPNSRWKLFKDDFDKKLKDTIDEFKAEEAKKAPATPPSAAPAVPAVATASASAVPSPSTVAAVPAPVPSVAPVLASVFPVPAATAPAKPAITPVAAVVASAPLSPMPTTALASVPPAMPSAAVPKKP